MILSKYFIYIPLKKGSNLIEIKVIDLYGGYFCYYSELECFIQHTLSTEINTDDGHNHFMIFHPIYIHVFYAVKNEDFDGAIFHIFNIYLYIYALMYDVMCKLNENNSSDIIDCNDIIEISH